jgi:hypothetical protein
MRDRARKRKAVPAVILCLFALAAPAPLHGPDAGAQAPPDAAKPPAPPVWVVSTGRLMELFNKPLYTQLKAEMAARPAGDGAWATLEARGFQAAEVANLIALRPAEPPQEKWVQLAANLQSAGVALANAARAKDWDGTTRAYAALLQRCNDCHLARAPGKAPVLQP